MRTQSSLLDSATRRFPLKRAAYYTDHHWLSRDEVMLFFIRENIFTVNSLNVRDQEASLLEDLSQALTRLQQNGRVSMKWAVAPTGGSVAVATMRPEQQDAVSELNIFDFKKPE